MEREGESERESEGRGDRIDIIKIVCCFVVVVFFKSLQNKA